MSSCCLHYMMWIFVDSVVEYGLEIVVVVEEDGDVGTFHCIDCIA